METTFLNLWICCGDQQPFTEPVLYLLLLLLGKEGLRVRASLAPSSRAKYNALEIDLDDYLIKGASAKGKRIANRTVRRVTDITGTPKKPKVSPLELPGFESGDKG